MTTTVLIKPLSPLATIPTYQTNGSAGLDLHACVSEDLTLEPGERLMVPTGLAMAIPKGYEGCVRPRSGWAWKHGLTVLNSPGTIDSDYRGEIKVILYNTGKEPILIANGERIAQLVVQVVPQIMVSVVSELDETTRGEGGFGSTGTT